MPTCLQLDVRDLEPPEPLQRIIEQLPRLNRECYLRVHHRREPFPLYAMLQEQALRWRTEQRSDGSFLITIWSDSMPTPPDTEEI